MIPSNRAGPIVVSAACAWLAGCYGYVPVSPATPAPGAVVRADVSDQAAAQLTSVLGPGVLSVNGMLLSRDDESMSILVSSYLSRRQGELSGVGDPVRVAIDQITRIEQKRLARGRSFLFGAAIAGGAIALMQVFPGDDRVLEPEDPNDPGQMDRRRSPGGAWTVFRIRFH